jgi:hypothetical protein
MDFDLTIFVRRGFHRGARLQLRAGKYVLGNSEECDLILNDFGIAPRHLEVSFSSERLTLEALAENASVNDVPLSIGEVIVLSGAKNRIRICGAEVYVFNPQVVRTRTIAPISPSLLARTLERGRHVPMIAAATLCSFVGLAGFSALSGIPQQVPHAFAPGKLELTKESRAGTEYEAIVRLGADLGRNQAWQHIKLKKNEFGRYEVTGMVADSQALTSLSNHSDIKYLGVGTKNVVVAGEVQQRISNFARNSAVTTTLNSDGRLIVSGSVSNSDEARRMKLLRKELEGKLNIDFQIEPRLGVTKAVQLPLPFKVASINVAQRYFETHGGEIYFEGSTLAAGFKVVSIDMNRILFEVGGKQVAYRM